MQTPPATQEPPPELPPNQRRLQKVVRVEQTTCLVSADSINHTGEKWGVYGTDLGSLFNKDGKMYLVFGDTFGCCPPCPGGPGSANDWRYNCMAVTTDHTPAAGLTFDSMISDRPGHAKRLLDKNLGDAPPSSRPTGWPWASACSYTR